MKVLDSLTHAIKAPIDDSDAISFTGGAATLLASPFIGWVVNVLTAVLVAFLSRLLWEFAKPLIEDFVGRKTRKFQDFRLDVDEHDIYKPGTDKKDKE
jgi:hypothetical protein